MVKTVTVYIVVGLWVALRWRKTEPREGQVLDFRCFQFSVSAAALCCGAGLVFSIYLLCRRS